MWKMGEGEVGHWREKSKDFLYAEETMGIKTPERGDIGLMGRGNGRWLLMVTGFLFLDDENVEELDSGDGF